MKTNLPECPFYTKGQNNVLFCEGVFTRCRNRTEFFNRKEREEVEDAFCRSFYKDCPLYHAINEKYA